MAQLNADLTGFEETSEFTPVPPGEYDVREADWSTPFLMHVSPVGTVDEAYYGLTGHHLIALP